MKTLVKNDSMYSLHNVDNFYPTLETNTSVLMDKYSDVIVNYFHYIHKNISSKNNVLNKLKILNDLKYIIFKIDADINLIGQIDVHINFIGNGLSQCYCIVHYAHTQCYGFKLFENLTLKLQFIVKQNVSNTNNA